MPLGSIKRYLIGHPLSNEMALHQRIPKWKGLAVLSSDALSSVAYATEEIRKRAIRGTLCMRRGGCSIPALETRCM